MNELPQFNIFDIIGLLYFLFGLYQGLRRGLSGELASVLSTALAFVGGWKLYQPLGDYLLKISKLTPPSAHALAFAILIIGGYIVLKIIRLLLRHLMEFSFKGKLERLGGALAGLIRVAVVASAFVLIVGLGPGAYLRNLVIEHSVFGSRIFSYLGPVVESLKERYPALQQAGGQPAAPAEGESEEPPVDEESGGEVPPITDEE